MGKSHFWKQWESMCLLLTSDSWGKKTNKLWRNLSFVEEKRV